MSKTPQPPSSRMIPPGSDRSAVRPGWTRIAAALTVFLCLLHSWAIWTSMEGWQGLTNGWPIWRFDHLLYYHSALVTRDFLAQSWTTAGYDPSFMAGYPKSVIFPASSTLPELVVALFGGSRPEFAYKVYVLISAALLPWLVAASGLLWRMGAGSIAIAVALFLVYIWTDFPVNYAGYGMLPYQLSIPLGLLATGVFQRYCVAGGRGWWLAAAIVLPLVVLTHLTSALIVAPAAAALYVTSRIGWLRGPGPKVPRRWRFHLGVVLIVVLVIGLNAFWWAPGLWLAGTKGPSSFAFAHPEGVMVRLRQIATSEMAAQRWLWVAGVPGLVVLWRKDRLGAVGLATFTIAGFAWGYLSGGLRGLDFLQPGRHTYAFYTGLAMAAGIGIASVLDWLRGLSRARLDLVALLLLLGGLAWDTGPMLAWKIKERVLAPFPFMASRPSPYLLRVVDRVKKHVRPGERLLYEEGGFGIPGQPDPFQEGRFSGLLARRLGIELIGGPYLHASLTTNFTQFGEGKLFDRYAWDRARFVRYARLYRPSAIVCWTVQARAFCQENPDLIEIIEDSRPVLIGRVKGFAGAAIVGQAEVEASPGRLRVTRAEAGLDGTVVLRYHSVPCLRSDPPVAWEPVYLEEDPVPFIRLRPPLGPVTFELRIPPGTRGAPARPLAASAGR